MLSLTNVARHIQISPARATRRQNAESPNGCRSGAAAGQTVTIAGALPGARVGGPEQRKPKDWPAQQLFVQVLHPQMAQLVSHVEPETFGSALHGIDDIRRQHEIASAEKLRGKSIQHSVAIQDVSLRRTGDIQPATTFDELRVYIRKLFRRELDRISLYMSDQS